MSRWRSKLNLTSDAVRSWPLANLRPDLSVQAKTVSDVYSQLSAMSGWGLALPGSKP